MTTDAYDELPRPDATFAVGREPRLTDTVIRYEDAFAKGVVNAMPSEDEWRKILSNPGQYVTEEVQFWQQLTTLLSEPELRHQLAENTQTQIKSMTGSTDALLTSSGLMVGALISPGGEHKLFSRMFLPELKGDAYVTEMLDRVVKSDPPILKTTPLDQVTANLFRVRPADTGSSLRDFMLDHLPPSVASVSNFMMRTYLERDLGLLTDLEFSNRIFASQALRVTAASSVGFGAYVALRKDEEKPSLLTPLLPVKPEVPAIVAQGRDALSEECRVLQKRMETYTAVEQFLLKDKVLLTPQDEKILECIGLNLINNLEKQSLQPNDSLDKYANSYSASM